MITWMAYGLMVSTLLCAAALALDACARTAGLPRRFIWLMAVIGVVALCVFSLRARSSAGGLAGQTIVAVADQSASADGPLAPDSGPVTAALARLRSAMELPLAATTRLNRSPFDRALAGAWLMATAGLILLGLFTLRRYGRDRRRWPRAEMAGVEVRVAPAAGPAVVGVLRPEIVVPAWLLATSAEEQRLVVLHEREHVRAGDPLLLAAGALTVALAPWNPIAWWMLHRLRLAVEMDCDARVLGGGVTTTTYGNLLIDIAGRGAGLSLRAAALAASSSTLEQRLKAMAGKPISYALARTAALGLLGSLALITACEARMPTTAEVDAMDVATLERRGQVLNIMSDGEATTYELDGRPITAEEARAIEASRILTIDVSKEGPDGPAHVRIRTSADGTAAADAGALRVVGAAGLPTDAAILFIDGERVEPSRINELKPDDVISVEVIKGDAAVTRFGDPAAARGVVRITTRAAASRRD